MTEPTITGEITLFGTDSKPLFSLVKEGDGEWHFTSFRDCEEEVDLTRRSAQRLREFMDFHELPRENQ